MDKLYRFNVDHVNEEQGCTHFHAVDVITVKGIAGDLPLCLNAELNMLVSHIYTHYVLLLNASRPHATPSTPPVDSQRTWRSVARQ